MWTIRRARPSPAQVDMFGVRGRLNCASAHTPPAGSLQAGDRRRCCGRRGRSIGYLSVVDTVAPVAVFYSDGPGGLRYGGVPLARTSP